MTELTDRPILSAGDGCGSRTARDATADRWLVGPVVVEAMPGPR
ncbi:MAG: hypothetical protein ABEI99_02440 [Halobaculum sp.]